MKIFTNYRKRILKKIAKLENERADLVRARSRISLSLSPEIIKEKLPRLRTDEIETDCLGNCFSDADEGL